MIEKWVIADVHGCCQSLIRLIEEKIQLGKNDELYLLGDYIDRGPDSKGVLDYIMHLQSQGYKVSALKGNHEDVLVRCYEFETSSKKHVGMYELKDSWLYHGGKATLKSFDVQNLSELPAQYIHFIKNLPLYIKLPDYILVHAGLNCCIKDPFSDTLSMLWLKDYPVDMNKLGNRRIIHGHVSRPLPLLMDEVQIAPAFSLDNGCIYRDRKGMGNLLAMELNSMEFKLQANVDYAVKTLNPPLRVAI